MTRVARAFDMNVPWEQLRPIDGDQSSLENGEFSAYERGRGAGIKLPRDRERKLRPGERYLSREELLHKLELGMKKLGIDPANSAYELEKVVDGEAQDGEYAHEYRGGYAEFRFRLKYIQGHEVSIPPILATMNRITGQVVAFSWGGYTKIMPPGNNLLPLDEAFAKAKAAVPADYRRTRSDESVRANPRLLLFPLRPEQQTIPGTLMTDSNVQYVFDDFYVTINRTTKTVRRAERNWTTQYDQNGIRNVSPPVGGRNGVAASAVPFFPWLTGLGVAALAGIFWLVLRRR